jgi:hypothetical protein
MHRRAFIQLLSAASLAAAFDPERLLWVPGQKTIFLPPERVFAHGVLRRGQISVPLNYVYLDVTSIHDNYKHLVPVGYLKDIRYDPISARVFAEMQIRCEGAVGIVSHFTAPRSKK